VRTVCIKTILVLLFFQRVFCPSPTIHPSPPFVVYINPSVLTTHPPYPPPSFSLCLFFFPLFLPPLLLALLFVMPYHPFSTCFMKGTEYIYIYIYYASILVVLVCYSLIYWHLYLHSAVRAHNTFMSLVSPRHERRPLVDHEYTNMQLCAAVLVT
jgi:hypothetical protein